jgi:uncharacterized protein (UPF0548 family)
MGLRSKWAEGVNVRKCLGQGRARYAAGEAALHGWTPQVRSLWRGHYETYVTDGSVRLPGLGALQREPCG